MIRNAVKAPWPSVKELVVFFQPILLHDRKWPTISLSAVPSYSYSIHLHVILRFTIPAIRLCVHVLRQVKPHHSMPTFTNELASGHMVEISPKIPLETLSCLQPNVSRLHCRLYHFHPPHPHRTAPHFLPDACVQVDRHVSLPCWTCLVRVPLSLRTHHGMSLQELCSGLSNSPLHYLQRHLDRRQY